MGDEGGMTRGDGGSQREREKREREEWREGWGGEGGSAEEHPGVSAASGSNTRRWGKSLAFSLLRPAAARKLHSSAENAQKKRQTAEKWTFSSPSDLNLGRVQAELTRRSAFIPTPAAVGTPCFCGTFLQLSRSWETQSKSLTWTEEGEEEEEEEKSSSGESAQLEIFRSDQFKPTPDLPNEIFF